MPLFFRVTEDMFEFADSVDYMCNPVNLISAPGAGLALEFRKRAPSFYDPYRAACQDKSLRMGTVLVIEDTDQTWGMICIPTKRHYVDTTSKEDLVRSLEALRDLLKTEQYRYASVGLPMLGCGLGTQDYPTVFPLMEDHLSDLDATVILSMSPKRTEMRPRYLVVVGPPDYGYTPEDQKTIDETFEKVMTAWGADPHDYTAIVSGGIHGVDSYMCGHDFNRDLFSQDVKDTFVFKRTGEIPFVVKANKVRNGVGANLNHNNLLCEIADDIILYKPIGYNNNRMSQMQAWLKDNKIKRREEGRDPQRIAVFGEHEPTVIKDKIIIPVQRGDDFDDLPY